MSASPHRGQSAGLGLSEKCSKGKVHVVACDTVSVVHVQRWHRYEERSAPHPSRPQARSTKVRAGVGLLVLIPLKILLSEVRHQKQQYGLLASNRRDRLLCGQAELWFLTLLLGFCESSRLGSATLLRLEALTRKNRNTLGRLCPSRRTCMWDVLGHCIR